MKAATLNDTDRSEWIDNDESLYNWWRSSRMSKRAFIKENRSELDAAIRSVRDRKPSRDKGSARDRLTTRQRERLPASQFALPERRALPIHDAAHVRNAAARLEQMRLRRSVTPREHSRALRAIQAREAQLGIGPFHEPRRDPPRARTLPRGPRRGAGQRTIFFEEDDDAEGGPRLTFYVRGPGAAEWAKSKQSILGSSWEVTERGGDFAYAMTEPYAGWRRDARQEYPNVKFQYLEYSPPRSWIQSR